MVSAAAGASKEDDIQKMLKCATHLGTKNCDVLMEPYVFKRRVDGMFLRDGDGVEPDSLDPSGVSLRCGVAAAAVWGGARRRGTAACGGAASHLIPRVIAVEAAALDFGFATRGMCGWCPPDGAWRR